MRMLRMRMFQQYNNCKQKTIFLVLYLYFTTVTMIGAKNVELTFNKYLKLIKN
jgi:hypothetical protein